MSDFLYDDLAEMLDEIDAAVSPSEAHGYVCGQFAGGQRLEKEPWLRNLQQFMDVEGELNAAVKRDLLDWRDECLAAITDPEFAFEPFVPEVEATLIRRLEALAAWTQGFLTGFGLASPDQTALPEDVASAVKDLTEVSRVDLETEENEESESAYSEVAEYVRMAALMIYMECGQVQTDVEPSATH